MSSRLITQVADHQLQIALIGQPSPLVEEIVHYCERQEFRVQRFTFDDVKKLTKVTEETEWYKVILVAEVTTHFSETGFETTFAQWQKNSPRQRIALITFPTLIDSAMPEYHQWATVSVAAKKVLQQISTVSSTLLIGQDVVTGEMWEPFQAISNAENSIELRNPELVLYPQPYLQFWQFCKQRFFNPQQGSVLYRGAAHPTEVIIREYQRQLRATPERAMLTAVSLPASPLPLPLTADQTITTELAALPDIVRPLVHQNNQVAKKASLPKPVLQPPKKLSSQFPLLVMDPSTEDQNSIAKSPQPANESTQSTNQELVEKVQAVFSEQRSQEKLDSVKAIAQAQNKATGKKKHRQWLFTTAIGFVSLGGLVIAAMGFYFISAFLLRQGFWSALQVFEQEKPTQVQLANGFIQQSSLVTRQTSLYSAFLPAVLLGSVPTWAEISDKMIVVHQEYETFAQTLGESVAAVVNPGLVIAPSPLRVAERYQATTTLSVLVEQLEQNTFSSERQQLLATYKNWLQSHGSELVAYQRLQPVLSQIVGSEQPRKYAVVFQNDQELRPTGGFIQSVGILTFGNGQLINAQTYGVYALDNQLKAHVTPPTEVTQLLGEESWFLRDSNWNPDFPKAASNMQWFIEHETAHKLDGVVTVTGPALAAILEAVGPVELPEYNEVITHRNLAERLEFHSEVQLTNQETTREYTELLLQRIFQKIQSLTPENGQALVAALQTQLHQKNMLLYLKDSGEQSTIQALGWSGKLLLPDCPSQLAASGKCLVDTLAVVDANIGVNKANYHLKRTEEHRVSLSETKATHTHTLTFNNTSQSNAWPQGAYNAYTRFYLPQNAQLQEVLLNDQVISDDKIVKTTYDIFSVVGVVSQTPTQKQTTLTIKYSTPLPQENKWAYAFFYQKQAGVPLALSAVEMTHSSTLTPKLIAPQAQVQLGAITFTNFEDDHVFVGVAF